MSIPASFYNELMSQGRWNELFQNDTEFGILGLSFSSTGTAAGAWGTNPVVPDNSRWAQYVTDNSFFGHTSGVFSAVMHWANVRNTSTTWIMTPNGSGRFLLTPVSARSVKMSTSTGGGSYKNQIIAFPLGSVDNTTEWLPTYLGTTQYGGVTRAVVRMSTSSSNVIRYMSNPCNTFPAVCSNRGSVVPSGGTGAAQLLIISKPSDSLLDLYCNGSALSTTTCKNYCVGLRNNTCFSRINAFCTSANIGSEEVCRTMCATNGVCDSRLTSYCTTLFNSSGQTLNDFIKDGANANVCGCFLTGISPNIYSSYEADLLKTFNNIPTSGDLIDCYFPACSNSDIHRGAFITNKTTCPNNSLCVNSVTINNNGTINGDIGVNQSNECSSFTKNKNTGGGGTTPTPSPPAPPTPSPVPANSKGSGVRSMTYVIGIGLIVIVGFLIIRGSAKVVKHEKRKRRHVTSKTNTR